TDLGAGNLCHRYGWADDCSFCPSSTLGALITRVIRARSLKCTRVKSETSLRHLFIRRHAVDGIMERNIEFKAFEADQQKLEDLVPFHPLFNSGSENGRRAS